MAVIEIKNGNMWTLDGQLFISVDRTEFDREFVRDDVVEFEGHRYVVVGMSDNTTILNMVNLYVKIFARED